MAANTANQFLQIPHNGAYGNKSVQVLYQVTVNP
jgi:hypothetical protein